MNYIGAQHISQIYLSRRRFCHHVVEHPAVAAHPDGREHDWPVVRVRRSDLGGPALGVHALQLVDARHGSIGGHGLQRGVGDAHYRRPVKGVAVGVERRPVHRLIAGAARPGGVPATVSEARLMTHQDLVGAEGVSVWASRRWVRDPLPDRGLNKITEHGYSL
jgi:hypothetical protein